MTEEYPVGGGKTIDLVAMRDSKRIAFEIETGQSDAAANVRKCLDAGMQRVVVVVTSKATWCNITMSVHPGPTFELRLASDMLRGCRRWGLEKVVLL